MYPYKIFISKPDNRFKVYPVWVNGYAQSVSASAFENRTLEAAYKAYAGFAGWSAYDAIPSFTREREMMFNIKVEKETAAKYGDVYEATHEIQEQEYDLFDFYLEIGYDKSSGKINGRTLRQHIKHHMKEKS